MKDHPGIVCLTHNDSFPILLRTKRKFLSTTKMKKRSVLEILE